MRWVLLAVALALPLECRAFPEMVRKGYNNCSACHHSPTGGGVLRQYGRELSREELSWLGREGEERAAYGAFKQLPDWAAVGGDIRAVQTYRENKRQRVGRFLVMQADFEAAVTVRGFTAAGTVGVGKIEKSVEPKAGFVSRRHWLSYRHGDELSLRAGRFNPAFGINVPDHVIATKRGLGWDAQSESYNVEAAWIAEEYNVFATGILGRPDERSLDREKGFALQASRFFADRYKAGVSYFYGSNQSSARQVAGPFGILGITPRLFVLSEWDIQWLQSKTGGTKITGVAGYNRLDYELVQGFHVFVTQEYLRLDLKTNSSFTESYGLGLQLFPRPHFELNLSWQKQRVFSTSETAFGDLGWFMFHFYL